LAAAAALGALSAQAKKAVEDAPQDTHWEPDLAEYYRNVSRYGTGAWAASGVGAALLVTGVILLVVDGKRAKERRAWLWPTLGPGQVSLGVGLGF
jgi:hypothetical protein